MGTFSRFSLACVLLATLSACNGLTGVTEKSYQIPDGSTKFASGTKAVRINLSNRPSASGNDPKGSFDLTATTSVSTFSPATTLITIPSGYPGYDGSSTYYPGVSAAYYFDIDGSTPITKPSWIKDVQVGYRDLVSVTSTPCSTFGDSGTTPVPYYFQTSEFNCHGQTGTGRGQDQTFIRIILDRDQAYIGTKENLLIQLEYDATGLRLNPDHKDSAGNFSSSANPEAYVDQLWKIFFGSSLASSGTPVPFSIVIPPNHAYHCPGGQGNDFTNCVRAINPVTTVRQFVFPLSSLEEASYIQISRVRGGRRNFISGAQDSAYYFAGFPGATCGISSTDAESPHCLGVVFRSLTLIRI